MNRGAIRVRTAAGSVRCAGFRFTQETVLLTSEQITPAQLLQLATDKRLVVEAEVDGLFVSLTNDMLAGIRVIADQTVGLSPAEVSTRLPDLMNGTAMQSILLAAGAIAAEEPGRGAGVDHPAAHPGAPVVQREADPNPALPAAGGTSDAGVEVERPVAEAAIDAAGLNGAGSPATGPDAPPPAAAPAPTSAPAAKGHGRPPRGGKPADA